MEGFLVIDKPVGLTSHDVVYRVRHILHEHRIGHTGTLDPFATGVLLIMVGRATRLAQFLKMDDKEYEAIIRIGYSTDTGDKTGKPTEETSSVKQGSWTEEEIEIALASLRGHIDQTPPMFSAKKIGGKKLYELARKGEEVKREPARVCIHEFEAIRPDGHLMKDNADGTFDFQARVACSSGTYVRTLAEDFGKRLHVGAHLAELRRTRVGKFTVDQAITLEELKTSFAEEGLGKVLVPPSSALSHLPLMHLTADDVRKTRHGMEVSVAQGDWADGVNVRMCDEDDTLIAVGDYDATKKEVHPRVVLLS